jgi:hypothetical protein
VPESLEAIKHAFLFVEDVRDDVTEVEQNPSAEVSTLAAKRLVTVRQHLILDFVGDCLDVSFIPPRDHDKRIDDSDWPAHIESDNVLSLFGVCRVSDDGDVVDGI